MKWRLLKSYLMFGSTTKSCPRCLRCMEPVDGKKMAKRVSFGPVKVKVKFSHTRYRALGPELITVYKQSAHR